MTRAALILSIATFALACDTRGTLSLDDGVPADIPGNEDPAGEDPAEELPDEQDPVETAPPEPSPFDGAVLQVVSPVAAGIDDDEDGALDVEAHVIGADGTALEFNDIRWTLFESGVEVFVGQQGQVPVENGIWTVIVEADLPNGDHLAAAVGGVRVQDARTGVYSGIVDLDATLNGLGLPVTASCLGSVAFVVDMNGETLVGDGDCNLDFLSISLQVDLIYDLTGDIVSPGASGRIIFDTGLIGLPMDWGGTFRAGDELDGSFDGFGLDLFGFEFDISGTFNAQRVTRYIDP